MPDLVALNDDSIVVVLNDANTLFLSLTDSASIGDATITAQAQPVLTDTVGITQSIAFDKELSLYENVGISDTSLIFTGLLFQSQALSATLSMNDATYNASERDSVFETGDYGSSAVFVITDLDNVGVFE